MKNLPPEGSPVGPAAGAPPTRRGLPPCRAPAPRRRTRSGPRPAGRSPLTPALPPAQVQNVAIHGRAGTEPPLRTARAAAFAPPLAGQRFRFPPVRRPRGSAALPVLPLRAAMASYTKAAQVSAALSSSVQPVPGLPLPLRDPGTATVRRAAVRSGRAPGGRGSRCPGEGRGRRRAASLGAGLEGPLAGAGGGRYVCGCA